VISVDVAFTGLPAYGEGLDAAAATFGRTGVGLSYYRPRPPMGEDVKPVKSYLILGIIKKRTGRDPLDPPPEVEADVMRTVSEEAAEALEEAFRTRRSQRGSIRRLLLAGAIELRDNARERIEQRQTGFMPTKRYEKKKAIFVRLPEDRVPAAWRNTTSRYGYPPPPLVKTGRLYESLSARWYEIVPRVPR